MYNFNYHRPATLDEARSLFQASADAVYLAGGMTLIPTLKQRLAQPSDVIDLSQLSDLAGIELADGRLTIGAFTRHAVVASSAEVRRGLPVLADLAGQIGDPQVRNRGTLGGSVANSDPAADYPAAVVALDAVVTTPQRSIAGADFFQDLFTTALEPGELITSIRFSVPDAAAYVKFPNPASRYAVVGALVARYGSSVRVGITGAGPCAYRFTALESALEADFTPAAVDGVSVDHSAFNSDLHATAEYRGNLVRVMAKRAVAALSG